MVDYPVSALRSLALAYIRGDLLPLSSQNPSEPFQLYVPLWKRTDLSVSKSSQCAGYLRFAGVALPLRSWLFALVMIDRGCWILTRCRAYCQMRRYREQLIDSTWMLFKWCPRDLCRNMTDVVAVAGSERGQERSRQTSRGTGTTVPLIDTVKVAAQ